MTPNQSAMLILKDFKRHDLPKIIEWEDFNEAELRLATNEILELFRRNPDTPPLPLLYDYEERVCSYALKKWRCQSLFNAFIYVTRMVTDKLINSV